MVQVQAIADWESVKVDSCNFRRYRNRYDCASFRKNVKYRERIVIMKETNKSGPYICQAANRFLKSL